MTDTPKADAKYEKIEACEKKILEDFFIERFKKLPEKDPGYFEEWKERFAKGNPERWMDSGSLDSYIKVLRKAVVEGCE